MKAKNTEAVLLGQRRVLFRGQVQIGIAKLAETIGPARG